LPDSADRTSLDFNRSGVPLLEIVGQPEISSADEAVEFLQLFRTTLIYLEICDGNMEEGSLRCDANLSLRRKGAAGMGVKTEIKNLNSFRFLHKALEYEAQRQLELLEKGLPIHQETRLWDASQNETRPMRSKEEAHDYRYFPEPDLPPLVISPELIEKVKNTMPELPQEKIERFVGEFQIPVYDAKLLAGSRELADYFEQAAKASNNPKQASNWIMREVLQHLKELDISISQFSVSPARLAELIALVDRKEITLTLAKEKVFPRMIRERKPPAHIVEEEGLGQISDEARLEEIIRRVIERNPGPLDQYLAGKTQVLGFFIGQVMKETKGQANAQAVPPLLQKVLDGYKRND
jgi:aspartyl-tRNA(Asn)/glutamyl-tRNA(Gln) amidotransferase subunit B